MKKTSYPSLILWLFCLSWPVIANDKNIHTESSQVTQDVTQYSYELLAQRSHKPTLFTQGLALENGIFYESSGLYGKSILVTYPAAESSTKWVQMTAPFSHKEDLPARYFAEGLTLINDKLYLLTWQEGTLFVYDRPSFTLEKQWRYSGEGWGLTDDDKTLIRSDGSHHLYFHNTEDFSVIKSIEVKENNRPIKHLNELEFINGRIWANIWHEDRLVEIDPLTGNVTGSLDLSSLSAKIEARNREGVLNGIAYDEQQDALWVTGKNWPAMYLIKLRKP